MMAMEKNAKRKIRLRVAGNDLTVVSSESEEYSRALASKMDKEIKKEEYDDDTKKLAEAIRRA